MLPSSLCLRPMQPQDLRQVMAIEERVFAGDAWPESLYRHDLENQEATHVVLELLPPDDASPRTLVGYAGFWLFGDEAHLMTIAIAPAWQHRGLGEALLLEVLDLMQGRGATVCTLEVRVSNSVAQALYRRVGFGVEGRRRHYYTDNNEDALIMTTPNLNSPAMRARRLERRAAVKARLERAFGVAG